MWELQEGRAPDPHSRRIPVSRCSKLNSHGLLHFPQTWPRDSAKEEEKEPGSPRKEDSQERKAGLSQGGRKGVRC